MRRLHSVIHVPEPSDAAKTCLHFFHATFLDYLTDQNRAGHFFIGQLVTDEAITIAAGLRDFVLAGLQCLGSTMGLARVQKHREVWGNKEVCRSLTAALSWPSGDAPANWECAKVAVDDFRNYLFPLLSLLLAHSELDVDLLGALRRFD